ncbi:hypothetical protein OG979_28830 [Actinomadura citrea]|uniref:hypothetical protein n=1 Tax=Actinomadura citrea TaxID=46158 RepID=UPI002E2A1129|nr:hypothetical protein [Actinomadura citrea]
MLISLPVVTWTVSHGGVVDGRLGQLEHGQRDADQVKGLTGVAGDGDVEGLRSTTWSRTPVLGAVSC